MADNQSSLNENLIAAGLNTSNPTSTYVDFAEQVAKNQAEQAQQEQTLALAKQHVAQATLDTKQKTEADQAGVNPELMNVMTPDQAAATLRLILKEKGLTISNDDITAWVAALNGKPVNRQVVEEFANRFAREATRAGQPAKFSTDMDLAVPAGMKPEDLGLVADESNPQVGHVPADGMYQVVYDNQGNLKKFIPGGKEPVDATAKASAKAAESAEKQWQKLDTTVNGAFKTRSGGLGSLSTAIFRAVRAINTLTVNDNLTAQDLENVAQDVAGIFQGGAPTVVTAKGNQYDVTLTKLADWFRAQTGIMANVGHIFGKEHSPLEPTKQKLLQVCVDLRDAAINNIKAFIESEDSAFREIIDANPERWADFQAKKLKFIESGILIPPGAVSQLNITGTDQAAVSKKPTDTGAGNQDKKDALRKKLGLPTQGN